MGAKSNQGAPATGSQQQQQQQRSMSTVNTGPWAPQQPYLEDAFAKAQANMPGAMGVYQGPRIAGLNPTQGQAFNDIRNMGDNKNVPAALEQNLATIRGDYLNSNPYIDKTFGMASDAVKRQYMTGTAPQTAGAMAAAGRYGSGAYRNQVSGNEQNYGKTLDDLATSIYGGNYANERGLQQQAVGMAPTLAQARYIDPQMRLMVGDREQAQTQAEYNDSLTRFNEGRDAPTRALNTYLAQIQGNYGQSGTNMNQSETMGSSGNAQQNPFYTNPGATAAGGALGLASLFNQAGGSGLFGKGNGTPSIAAGSGSTY
jgi:hypothetical protein